MKEPEGRSKFERVSSFTRPVCAGSANKGGLAAPKNSRSMTARVKEPKGRGKPMCIMKIYIEYNARRAEGGCYVRKANNDKRAAEGRDTESD